MGITILVVDAIFWIKYILGYGIEPRRGYIPFLRKLFVPKKDTTRWQRTLLLTFSILMLLEGIFFMT